MSKKRVKQYLTLLMSIGIVAVIASGGGGTFATFSAETTNANNTFATGTLFLHDTSSGVTCTSESASDNLTPTGCKTLFSVTNLAPNATQTANLTLTNAGSVNSAQIQFDRPSACSDATATLATLNTSATDASTSLSLANLGQALTDHTQIKVTDGASNETYQVTTTVAAGNPQTVNVTPVSGTGSHTYPVGSTVTLVLGFNSPALCSNLQIYVDEMNSGFTSSVGCAYGTASGGAGTPCTSGTSLASLPASLTPLNLTPATGLAAGTSRYFRITINSGSLGNVDQAAQATFSLLWHLEH